MAEEIMNNAVEAGGPVAMAGEVLTSPEPEKYDPFSVEKAPKINVLDSKSFQKRVGEVFAVTANTLAKSYGPYGSSTIITNYPFNHVTKDGFSIMKMISFSKEVNMIDDSIKNLIEAPCSRLNYAVGDGTTTAIIAVNSIYQQYMQTVNGGAAMDLSTIPPRDLMKSYDKIRDRIIDKLDNETIQINMDNHEEMVNTIRKIAYISSNADETITNLITDLYDEIGYPSIDIKKAADGITKKTIVDGYQFDCILKDSIYVNNDDYTAEYNDADILLFDHKVTMDTYNYILAPMADDCRKFGRHLVMIAPVYDDVAMLTISRQLREEYQATRNVALVLMVGRCTIGIARALFEDLALITNTTIINMAMEREIIEKVRTGVNIFSLINLHNRNISGLTVPVVSGDQTGYTVDNGAIKDENRAYILEKDAIRCGYAGHVILGMKNGSIFKKLLFDEELYKKTISNIEYSLKESKKKSEAITAFNIEAADLQSRLNKLRMKVGTIEVGGESELSQGLLYDAVDDTVKATSSAYHNGYVYGCSLSTIRAARSVLSDIIGEDPINYTEYLIAKFIYKGFRDIFSLLLTSRFGYKDGEINMNQITTGDPLFIKKLKQDIENVFMITFDDGLFDSFIEYYRAHMKEELRYYDYDISNGTISLMNTIIDYAIFINLPFDLVNLTFNDSIINSAKTDKEVLKASSDLISLLITGNQFILADHQ